MNEYRFKETEAEDGVIGTLEMAVPDGHGGKVWQEDMKSELPFSDLATKKYVDNEIKEADPDYKGTFTSLADIGAITDANANDWAYLQEQDAAGNDVYSRYRYRKEGGWTFEVAIKRDNFTDQEWAAVTSGITSGKVEKLDDLPTAADIAAESAFQKNFATIAALASDPNAGVTTTTTNPEWKIVYTDANDAILMGKRQDNTWYFATDLDTILDAIIEGYGT